MGMLRDSSGMAGDPEALRAELDRTGYLYLPGFLDVEEVRAGRRALLGALFQEGLIEAVEGPGEAVVKPGVELAFRPDLAALPEVQSVVRCSRLTEFYEALFGEPILRYDFTWLRAAGPGVATKPHYDIVYMGRGTDRVMTAWIPFSDIGWEESGLAILEGSHRLEDLKSTYGRLDVDVACSNKPGVAAWQDQGYTAFGALSDPVDVLAARFGLTWATAPFRMGDLLTFTMHTLHCSTDNRSNRVRLSTDSRTQPASLPADERWIGKSPIGHGPAARREMIC